jgi:hypothetical protein
MFKEGDFVKGTVRGNEKYTSTGEFMLKAEVTEVYDDGTMEIIVVDHEFGEEHEGEVHDVEMKYFDFVSTGSAGSSTSRGVVSTISKPSNDYELLVAIGQL